VIAALFRRPDPGVCLCGHPKTAHEHFRPGSDCGSCGAAVCRRYRPARRRRAAVHRTDQAIDAVLADDITRALRMAPARDVGLLVALRDLREVTRW
jgi:hypothetical protein